MRVLWLRKRKSLEGGRLGWGWSLTDSLTEVNQESPPVTPEAHKPNGRGWRLDFRRGHAHVFPVLARGAVDSRHPQTGHPHQDGQLRPVMDLVAKEHLKR